MEFLPNEKKYLISSLTVFLAVVSLFFVGKIASEIKNFNLIGRGVPSSSMISFIGDGEVFASPNIANISFTVRQESKTVSIAQSVVNEKISKAISLMKVEGILEKDIKTRNYNTYPKYDYFDYKRKPQLIGYEVSQTVSVKVRKIDDAGRIIDLLGGVSATEIEGPFFEIDDKDALLAQARKMAILEAKDKAEKLAKDLGVRLVRIIGFYEGGGPAPDYPMAFAGATMMKEVATSIEIPVGEEKISSNVTITYEIE